MTDSAPLGFPRLAACTARVALAWLALASPGCVVEHQVLSCEGAACADAAPSTTPAECLAKGNDYGYQADGRCTQLLSRRCTRLFGPEVRSAHAPVYVGYVGLASLAPAFASDTRAAELAARAIERAGGVPTADGPRQVVVVACDATEPAFDREALERAAAEATHHLVDTLGVSALVLALPRGAGLEEAATLGITKPGLVVSSLDAAPFVFGEEGRYVAFVPRPRDALTPLPALLASAVEPARRSLVTGRPLRLALVTDQAGDPEIEAALAPVRWNGKTLAQGQAESSVLRETASPSAAERVARFTPDVVVDLSDAARDGEGWRARVEDAWPASTPKPAWVLRAAPEALDRGDVARLAGRLHVLSPEAPEHDDAALSAFRTTFVAAFPDAEAPPPGSRTYDAVVLAALAAARAPTLSGGARLASLVTPGGTSVRTDDVGGLVQGASGGAPLDVRALDGLLRFDAVGRRRFDGVTWCPTAGGFVRSGLRWSALEEASKGTVACP